MFGNEVRFKIGGDVTQLERSFSRAQGIAERAGQRMESSMRKTWQAMRAPNESFTAFKERWKAEENAEKVDKVRMALAQQRKKIAYDEANTVGKIKIVTQELADLSRARTREKGETVKKLAIELQMEEKLATLRRLRQTQAQTNLAQSGGGGVAGADAGDGGWLARMRVSLPSLLVRAVGGAITMGLSGLLGRQRAQQQIADAQVDSTGAALGSMREKFAAIGGLRGQLAQGQARSRDLAGDLKIARDREAFLSEGALMKGVDFLTKMGLAPDELTKTQERIQQINAEIQKQGDANDLVARELKRQEFLYYNQLGTIGAINSARQRGVASELKLAEIAERHAKVVLAAEQSYGTPESRRAAEIQLEEARGATSQATRNTIQRQRDVNQSLAQDAADGRTFANGRPRPRSEAERLAQRAARYREQARNLVITNGRAGSTGAGEFISAAMRDEAEVGSRFSAGSARVEKTKTSDASSLKAEITKSNQILTAISQSLTVVEVGDIIRK